PDTSIPNFIKLQESSGDASEHMKLIQANLTAAEFKTSAAEKKERDAPKKNHRIKAFGSAQIAEPS
ncbi:hypothetical protein, partial [Anaerotruncus rubiinfantis]|uniref:hypothetical protein n=1 Tax=Anaerotruncus rubiinfantis TaxID=1720200 RepID=UPI0034A17A76